MRKISFGAKLKREGILELVEPSEEIMQSYLKKSESYLGSAKILLQRRLNTEQIQRYRETLEELVGKT